MINHSGVLFKDNTDHSTPSSITDSKREEKKPGFTRMPSSWVQWYPTVCSRGEKGLGVQFRSTSWPHSCKFSCTIQTLKKKKAKDKSLQMCCIHQCSHSWDKVCTARYLNARPSQKTELNPFCPTSMLPSRSGLARSSVHTKNWNQPVFGGGTQLEHVRHAATGRNGS